LSWHINIVVSRRLSSTAANVSLWLS